MSWQETLLDASFRGLVFDVKNTKDSAKRGIVEHSYPFRDGAELEDSGRAARRITLTAIFWGPEYESALQAFIEVLDEGGEGELIHPVFGALPVMVEGYEIPHDAEQPDYVEVSVNFVESGRENPFFAREFNAETKGEEALGAAEEAVKSLGQSLADYITEIAESLSVAEALAVLDDVHGLLSNYRAIKNAILSGLNYLDFPIALVGDLQSIIGEVAGLASLGSDSLLDRFRGWQGLSDLFARLPLSGGGGKSSYATSPAAYSATTISGPAGSQ
jgi:prophage DNA circulation protein